MKKRLFVLAVALCCTLIAGRAIAQHEQPKKPDAAKPAAQPEKPATKPGDKPAAPSGAGQMDPEAMKRMMEAGTPGPEHEAMKPLVGNWACDVSFTMMPGAPPEKSSGTLKREMIMDGRYLSEDFEGTAMGMPFKGHGMLGYDRGQKQYQSVWIDSMSTMIYFQTGKGEAGGKKITFEGENFDPMEGKKKWGRSTLEITSNDKHALRMWTKGPDGKEFQTFEMTCTRK